MKLPDFSENFHSEKEKKILDDLDEKMDGLRQLISNTLNRHVFADEQAWTWPKRLEKWAQQVEKNSRRRHDTACYTMLVAEIKGSVGAKRLEKWTQQIEKNSRHDTACYTMGTMGFSCVRGILIESFAMNRKMPNR